MIANIFKTVGLCLTSLNSFNIQTKNAENQTEIEGTLELQYTTISNQTIGQQSDIFTNGVYITQWGKLTSGNSNITVEGTTLSQTTYFTYMNNDNVVGQYNNVYTTLSMQIYKITFAENYVYDITYMYKTLWQNTASTSNVKATTKMYTAIQNIGQTEQWATATNTELTNYILDFSNNNSPITKIYNTILGNNYVSEWNLYYTFENTQSGQDKSLYNDMDLPFKNAYNKPYYVVYLTTTTSQPILTGEHQLWTMKTNEPLAYGFDFIQKIVENNINYEVIDLPGLMFTVLGMPFTFVSTAFNLTVFPGTPYQLNLSALFLAILGLLFFVFIVSIIKGKMK